MAALGDVAVRGGCPKHMVFGPCGGVRDDGACELAAIPCAFLDDPAPPWPTPSPIGAPGRPPAFLRADGPTVLTDLTVEPFDPASIARVVEVLAPGSDALLVGEHQNRPDFPPTAMVPLVRSAGGRPVVTLTCRDRNRIVLEQELRGLAALSADAVLCVTGDGRAQGVRPEVTQVFDLDGVRLAGLAASLGLPVAVAESPQAAPRSQRVPRLLTKQQAGAGLCVLNHVADAETLAGFLADARARGVTLPFIAAVAVYTDARSAEVLARFPGLHLDPAAVAAVLDAPDPVTAGIAAAVGEAQRLLAVPGVIGVNLSGLGSARGVLAAARVKAAVSRELR